MEAEDFLLPRHSIPSEHCNYHSIYKETMDDMSDKFHDFCLSYGIKPEIQPELSEGTGEIIVGWKPAKLPVIEKSIIQDNKWYEVYISNNRNTFYLPCRIGRAALRLFDKTIIVDGKPQSWLAKPKIESVEHANDLIYSFGSQLFSFIVKHIDAENRDKYLNAI
jgi:hypothetical protein